MDVIIASSRGKGLEDEIKQLNPLMDNVKVLYSSGARLNQMAKTAVNLKRNHPHEKLNLYILGGYCDISKRVGYNTDRGFYEEFIFVEDPQSAADRVTSLIHDLKSKVQDANTQVTFYTIPPSHLQTWNNIRLKQHKTCMLKHTNTQYHDMQTKLIK